METNEKKICSYTQNKTRLQLLRIAKLNKTNEGEYECTSIKYQVRLNRRIISSSISEYNERKVFATYAQNIVLQLKIF